MTAPDSLLLQAFARQQRWCEEGGSPFSARVLQLSRPWLQRHAGAHAALAALDPDPLAAALPLRWLAALHHLALLGREPWARLWPGADGAVPAGTDAELQQAFGRAWDAEPQHLAAALAQPPQTNEVMRSAVLLPGLLAAAQATGLPLHLVEIGSSAGLNLFCDHYRHDAGHWRWGRAEAVPALRPQWRGPAPPRAAVDAPAGHAATAAAVGHAAGAVPGDAAAGAPLAVARRAGCDLHPVDLLQPGQALRLESFVWADQHERRARLRAAVARVAAQRAAGAPPVVARHAGAFVREQLGARRRGEALVLMHSVVWQYIDAPGRADIAAAMHAAGAAATAEAPLAWLRMEPPQPGFGVELRLRTWPGGGDRLLARAHPHGSEVEWLEDQAA